ncbi:MAG: hypothetical protein RIR96_25 [Bacteroidota bacterium]|jgi:hypothetical protein
MKSITTKISSLLLVGLIVFQACKKETQPTPNNNNPDPCANVSITISATATSATPCSSTNNGAITVTATGSSGYTYNINGGAYQSGNSFSGLSAGSYTIGVKDANGCSKTQSISVGTVASGPLLDNVVTLINNRCANCHTNGGSNGGLNLDNKCNIVTNWSTINNRCVVLGNMPSANPLNASEKQIITNWVNAGHRYTD